MFQCLICSFTAPLHRADADRVASHPNPNRHVGGVQERHGRGAADGLGLRGPYLPLFGSSAALPQEPFWFAAGTQAGCYPTWQPSELPHPSDWRSTAPAGWWRWVMHLNTCYTCLRSVCDDPAFSSQMKMLKRWSRCTESSVVTTQRPSMSSKSCSNRTRNSKTLSE